jgi:outer membrane protein assembly factor BamB
MMLAPVLSDRWSVRSHALAVVLAAVVAPLQAQDTWPSFRNDGSGTVSVTKAPTQWSPDTNIAWRVAIPGYGQSAPVVWKSLVFLTSSDGPWQERGFVHAFDLKTGEKRWTTEVPATTKIENYFRNSRAAPTCVVDARIVVSFFPGGDVTAMSHDGETLWTVPLFKKYGETVNDRAAASSLAQTAGLVYVLVDHDGPSWLIALRKADGSVAWKADRGTREPSWSSPVIASHAGRELVIASSSGTVDAYDAKTGERLWQVEGLHGNLIPSASVAGDSVFVGATQPAHGMFNASKVASSNSRIRLTLTEGGPSYEISWGAKRAKSYYSTPLAFAGYVYYVNRSGILYCVDAETGTELYRERIGSPSWASAIGVTTSSGESLVYFVMKTGETLILRPATTFQAVARNELWNEEQLLAAAEAARAQRAANAVPPEEAPPKEGPEAVFADMPEKALHEIFSYGDPTVYGAVVVEGRLLVRTGQHLYCVAAE